MSLESVVRPGATKSPRGFTILRPVIVLALAVLASVSPRLSAQVFSEAFAYPDGEISAVSGGVWAVQLAGTPLNVTGGAAVINQGDLTQGAERVSRNIDPPFTTTGRSSAYYSFQAKWTALPVTESGSYFVNLGVSTNASNNIFYGRVGADVEGAADGMFRVSVANANWSQANSVEFPADLSLNVNYLIVARYDLTTGNTTLWVNPGSENDTSVTATDPPAAAQQAIAAINLRQGLSNSSTGAPGIIEIRNLVVGASFGEVTVQGPPVITSQPSDTSAPEGALAVFKVGLANASLVSVQWRRNETPIPDGTNTTLSYGPIKRSDDGAQFDAVLTNPRGSTNTVKARLSVLSDTEAPALVAVVNLDPVTIQLRFSEPLALPGALQTVNYVVGPGVTVTAARVGGDPKTILLTVSPLTLGNQYVVTVNHVTDQATIPNPIAPDTQGTFVATGLIATAIGAATPFDAVIPLPDGGYGATSAGVGGEAGADQLQFGWKQVTGDFDQKVRVERIDLSDVWAQAGLMVRETLDATSRYAAVMATPSLNGIFFATRTGTGASVSRTGPFPVNYPNTWLRIRRAGNAFTAFAGYDGNQWVQLGTVSIAMPTTVYLGLSVSSHKPGVATTARFHDLGDASLGTIAPILPATSEPPGPSSRKTGIAITEFMFHPAARADGRNLAYIELYNSNPWTEDISGYQLAGDIAYTFPAGTIIPGGGFLVVARSPSDLQSAYGISGVLGPYADSLPPTGLVRLLNNGNSPAVYLQIPYADLPPWTTAADGTGHSLVLKRPSYGEGSVEAWGISELKGGSPGAAEPMRPTALRQVFINELLVHPATSGGGYVELYNHYNSAADVSGCRLTDFPGTNHYVLPPGTTIPPRGFLSLAQDVTGLAFEREGGSIFLESADGQQILDVVVYEAQEKGVSLGRIPDGGKEFYRTAATTPGAANGASLVSDVVINELLYKPISRLKDDQFVELYNQGSGAVDLGGWKFVHGISYTIPTGTVLAPHGYLVVARNAARMLTNYPNLTDKNTVGDFSGSLAGSGERVALARPLPFVSIGKKGALTTNLVEVIVDEVTYAAGGRWGHWSDEGGSSLELKDPRSDHRLAANWGDSDETAKAPWTTIEQTSRLDLGSAQGGGAIDRLEIQMGGEGECLLDNVEVIQLDSGTNRLSAANSTFESGIGGWFSQGDHIQTSLQATGGVDGGQCLHIHSTDRGDTGANHIRVPLQRGLTVNQMVTIRAQVRWLRGFPFMVLRTKGNYAEASGTFNLPRNPGTPGAPNTQSAPNAGPAIADVIHSPVLPAQGQPVVVSARVDDPDGLSQVTLFYRTDPAIAYLSAPMTDDGTGGDAVAGDGIYSGTIPGMPARALVAFYIQASDAAASPAQSRFPADAPARECLVRFGEPNVVSAFGAYHFWLTQNNANAWSNLGSLSNERWDGTFVVGDFRVIYNVRGKFAGSPYHQGFGSPVGNQCHYSFDLPGDDRFLGATSFNKIHAPGNGPWEDDSLQREQTAYWMARSIGLPWNYRRYVNFFINGSRREPTALMEDSQTPASDVVEENFPDDTDGHLYKLQPWFEFADNGSTFDNKSWCTLNNYVSLGQKKLARYRPNFLARGAHLTGNEYDDVFQLIDVASLPSATAAQKDAYVRAIEAIVDTDEWLGIMAIEHAVGNWDSFLNTNGQNMYAYKPQRDRWRLLIWDYNIVLGLGGYTDGPTGDDLFKITSGDNGGMTRLAGLPVYRRALWRALEEIANGPMNNANVDPVLDAKYAAFKAEGMAASQPSPVKSWIRTRHGYLVSRLQSVATTFAVTTANGADFATADNPVVLDGTAPVGVRDIEVNGLVYPVTWTDVRHWELRLPLSVASTPVVIRGIDRHGQPISGDEAHFNVTYTGVLEPLAGQVVLNEIMYHPQAADTEFIEIYNRASATPYDLSNWRLEGVDYSFPEGTVINPGSFVLLARNPTAFAATYGHDVPVSGVFGGFPASISNGVSLRLVRPATDGGADVVVSGVNFRNSAPWPAAADGTGASLQLIDPFQDDSRVGNWAVGGPDPSAQATPGRSNAVAQTLPAIPALWINEVLAENNTPAVDNAGEHDPFVELYNGGAASVDLAGMYLSDGYDRPDAWKFPAGTTIDPGKFLVVWADGQPAQSIPGVPHTSFRISAGAGSVLLSSPQGVVPALTALDYLDYAGLNPGRSFGSSPDGQSLRRTRFYFATPGASNNAAAGPNPVYINEWMASNTHSITNPATGLADDWFELYNSGKSTVDLGGFQLSNPINSPSKFVIPQGTSIGPGGFLLVWADKANAANSPGTPLHVNFKLGKSGEEIGLFTPGGELVDGIQYGPQDSDVSEGRAPDGADGPYARFYLPTPGAVNVPLALTASYDRNSGHLQLDWITQPGFRYRLVTRETIDGPWQTLGEFQAATTSASHVDDTFGRTQRYYRLMLENGN